MDPLYVIFEQHLYNFQDDDADRRTFIGNIVKDYLTYLRKMNIVVPKSLEHLIVEELAGQVNTMLVKKIYGCLSIDEYRKGSAPVLKKKAKTRYTRLAKAKTAKVAGAAAAGGPTGSTGTPASSGTKTPKKKSA
jgi:hypothetical protein